MYRPKHSRFETRCKSCLCSPQEYIRSRQARRLLNARDSAAFRRSNRTADGQKAALYSIPQKRKRATASADPSSTRNHRRTADKHLCRSVSPGTADQRSRRVQSFRSRRKISWNQAKYGVRRVNSLFDNQIIVEVKKDIYTYD